MYLHSKYPGILKGLLGLSLFIFTLIPAAVSQTSIDISKPVILTEGAAGNTSTGAATYTIPLKITPGIKGMTPSVELTYSSSGSGNGFTGHGWSFSGISMITRSGKAHFYDSTVSPVNFTSANDAFILDGQRLQPLSGSNGADGAVYGAEQEAFSKIISYGGDGNSPDYFTVTKKDGTVLEYGTSNTKMLADSTSATLFWLLRKVTYPN